MEEVRGASFAGENYGLCDDDVYYSDYYCIGERLKLEGETENMGVYMMEREGHDSRGGHSLH